MVPQAYRVIISWKFAVEIGGGGHGFIHVRVAEHGAADFKSRLKRIARGGRQKKIEQRGAEGARAFEIREMRGVQAHHGGIFDSARENFAMALPGRGNVAIANDQKRGRLNFCEQRRLVHIANGGAACGIAKTVGREERCADAGGARVAAIPGFFAEKTLHRGVGNCGSASGENRKAARFPIRGRSHARRGVGEHKMRDAAGRVRGKRLPRHASDAEAAKANFSILSASAMESTSRPSWSIVYSPSGMVEAPWPRRS